MAKSHGVGSEPPDSAEPPHSSATGATKVESAAADNWLGKYVADSESQLADRKGEVLQTPPPAEQEGYPVGRVDKPSDDAAPTRPGNRLRKLAVSLGGVFTVQTIVILVYFAFRSEPAAAVFRMQKEQLAMLPDSGTATSQVVVSAGGDADFSSIAAAVEQVAPGTHIVVRPGKYREQIVLAKPVEIVGDGSRDQIVVEFQNSTVLTVQTDQATIRRITVVRIESSTGKDAGGISREDSSAIRIPQGRLVIDDCDITSQQGCCVLVHGRLSEAVIRGSTIRDGKTDGLVFDEGGGGLVEDCEFFGNGNTATTIARGASTKFQNCRFDKGPGHAVHVLDADGHFENCTVSGHARHSVVVEGDAAPTFDGCTIELGGDDSAGVVVKRARAVLNRCDIRSHSRGIDVQGGNPLLRECTIAENRAVGAAFSEGGTGRFFECPLSGNKRGVLVTGKSSPCMHQCPIQGGEISVQCQSQSAGVFTDCEFRGATLGGVVLRAEADPVFLRCTIRDCQGYGFSAAQKSRGYLDDCHFVNSATSAVHVTEGASPFLTNTRLTGGKGHGVLVDGNGSATLEECEIVGYQKDCCRANAAAVLSLRQCRISDSPETGLTFNTTGVCRLIDCDVSQCQTGLLACGASSLMITGSEVHDCRSQGMLASGNAKLTLGDCKFRDNASDNVAAFEQAELALVKCYSFQSQGTGVRVNAQARAVMEDCRFYANRLHNVAIDGKAELVMTRCTMRDAGDAGVQIANDAEATLVECEIEGSQNANVLVEGAGKARIHDSTIRLGKAMGVHIPLQGQVTIVDSEVSGHANANVLAANSAMLRLRRSKLLGGKEYGLILSGGQALVEECELTDSAAAGIKLTGGTAQLRKCLVNSMGGSGVAVSKDGRATLDECVISNNSGSGITVVDGGKLDALQCEISGNVQAGIEVGSKATATVEGGSIVGNKLAGIRATENESLTLLDVTLKRHPISLHVLKGGRAQLTGCTSQEVEKGDWVVTMGGILKGERNTPALSQP